MKKIQLSSTRIISMLNTDSNTASFVRKYIYENLLIRTGEINNSMIGPGGDVVVGGLHGHSAAAGYISVAAGDELFFYKGNTTNIDNIIRYAYYDNNDNLISSRRTNGSNYFIHTVPASATRLRISYPTDSNPRVERKI